MNNSAKLTYKGYGLLLSSISKERLEELENNLTVMPTGMDIQDSMKYKLYSKTNKYIYIPRYYGIEHFGIPEILTYNPYNIEFNFKKEMRDYQKPIIDICMKHIMEKGGGLLAVPCGEGKTSMALKIASLLKVPTIVVVHKTFLMDQWRERIEFFTDAKIGTIRQNIMDIDNKDIVIAMIQSLSKRDYDLSLLNKFGLVIFDECHHSASKMFSKALAKTAFKYTIGLSATPYRQDGLIKVMHWYLGETMFLKKLKTNNQVVSKIITFDSTDENYKSRQRFILGKLRPDCVKMISDIIENEHRNKLLIDIINTLRIDPLRKILILSGRKKHLEYLKTNVDKTIKNKECITTYYHGELNKAEREYSEKNGDILFATYDMAHEGLDIERLNTIILATSKKDVVQAVGRILRKILDSGDIRPLIIDIKDNLSPFIGQAVIREKFYKNSKYIIEKYNIMDDTYENNINISNLLLTNKVEIIEDVLEIKKEIKKFDIKNSNTWG
jgi:superfamily II DNA or RNA helicase